MHEHLAGRVVLVDGALEVAPDGRSGGGGRRVLLVAGFAVRHHGGDARSSRVLCLTEIFTFRLSDFIDPVEIVLTFSRTLLVEGRFGI